MEFGLREWLTVFIALLILGILLDGWRRMRQSRQGSIKMSRSVGKSSFADAVDNSYSSELPGPARVVKVRDDEDSRERGQAARENVEQSKNSIKPSIPDRVSFNFDDLETDVPTLMQTTEPLHQESLFDSEEPNEDKTEELHSTSTQSLETEDVAVLEEPQESVATTHSKVEPSPVEPKPAKEVASDDQKQVEEEVFVINVMAAKGEQFDGEPLLNLILDNGLRFGDMSIFHHHLDEDGEGPVLFSMANMVKPGTFDLNEMSSFTTPGISLFMVLPVEADSMTAFNAMAAAAQSLAIGLGGELKDENRSVMTMQTLEHCRQRIQDFERKRLV